MLTLRRQDLAANLAAYGESEAAARIEQLTADEYRLIGEIGFRHALDGKEWFLAGCLAAVEVIEGTERPLHRKRRNWADVPPQYCEPDPLMLHIQKRHAEYSGGQRLKRDDVANALAKY